MGIIEDLKKMQEVLRKLPPVPKRIEVTNNLYCMITHQSYINELIYEKPKYEQFGFCGVQLWIASEEEQGKWTEEEKKKQFKTVF